MKRMVSSLNARTFVSTEACHSGWGVDPQYRTVVQAAEEHGHSGYGYGMLVTSTVSKARQAEYWERTDSHIYVFIYMDMWRCAVRLVSTGRNL